MKGYRVIWDEPGYELLYAKESCKKCHGAGRRGIDLVHKKMLLCGCIVKGRIMSSKKKPQIILAGALTA